MSNLAARPPSKASRHCYFCWTVLVMVLQIALCCLVWAFAKVMILKKVIMLPDIVARWTKKHPSDTNMTVTVISTILAAFGFLGITVRHALAFRLPRGIKLPVVTVWAQLATNSLFLEPRRYLLWTIVAGLWFAVTHYLTAAWSNILIPVPVTRQWLATRQELDFLSPAFANFAELHLNLPSVPPTARNYSLTPADFHFLGATTGYLLQAGVSAISGYLQPVYPAFISQFNSSTGGINPTSAQNQLTFPAPAEYYRGLSTSYTLTQQGYTAEILCKMSSSPSITLVNSSLAQHTFVTPSTTYSYALDAWSWNTNCSGNGEYYSGEVDISTSNGNLIGNGLFATSVCFYQDFSGPSSKSFLVLMQSPTGSGYSESYFSANPSLPIVCQVTPMVTTVEVQYNQTGLANITKVLEQNPLPDNSWILASIPATVIWGSYLFAQGPHSNAFADGLLQEIRLANATPPSDVTPIVEQYLRGMFEFMGSEIRATLLNYYSQQKMGPIPVNMTTVVSGTMSTQTVGWEFHPRTHSFALGAITMVTAVTVAFGIYAISEAGHFNATHDPPQKLSDSSFDPTKLVDFLAAASMGNLANALSKPRNDDYRDQLVVELDMTTEGHTLLNVYADYVEGTDHAEEG